MLNLEVVFLILWMEVSWAIRKRLYLAYIAIPPFFYFLSFAIQSIRETSFPLYFLPSAVALSFLFTSFLIVFGFVQKERSFFNLSRLSGSSPLYIFLGELSFSSLIAIPQSILFFLLIRIFSGIGSFGSFILFLLASFLFSSLYTLLFLLLSLILKFQSLDFLYIASGFLLVSLFLSNIFFPIYSLPSPLRFLALLNPLTYAVEGFNWTLGGRSSLPFFSPWLFWGVYLILPILCIYALAKSSGKSTSEW